MIDVGVINPYIIAVLAVLASIDGAAFVLLYREMRASPQVLMSKFKLNGDKTVRDFGVMLVSNIGLALSMLLSALGVIYSNQIFMIASYIGQALFALLIVGVFASWVKKYAID